MAFQTGWRAALAGLAAAGMIAAGASAQRGDSTNQVGVETAWAIFVETEPTECWVVAEPTEIVNSRDGRVVAVRRGEIQLFVSYKPSANVAGQVSFTGGYPFPDDYTATLRIGDDEFRLFTDNLTDAEGDSVGWAWPAPEDDARIVAAMKAGIDAKVTAISRRGTTTEDTFSLIGFTAAVTDAERRCTS